MSTSAQDQLILLLVEEKELKIKITDLHPTQLYLSEKKLHDIQMLDQSAEIINVDPISVLAFGNRFLITDGHHRAYQALLAGRDTISAEFDRDGGDELYALYAQACEERKISSVLDLKHRILPQDEYEAKWYNWCDGFNQAATLLLKGNQMKQTRQIDNARPLVPLYIEISLI